MYKYAIMLAMTILLVEDERKFAHAIKKGLEIERYMLLMLLMMEKKGFAKA